MPWPHTERTCIIDGAASCRHIHTTRSPPQHLLHTYQQSNSMGRSKLSHRVKGRNILLKRNRLIIMSAWPATTSPPCAIKGLSSHLTNHTSNHALRLKMLLAYFLYLIKKLNLAFYVNWRCFKTNWHLHWRKCETSAMNWLSKDSRRYT